MAPPCCHRTQTLNVAWPLPTSQLTHCAPSHSAPNTWAFYGFGFPKNMIGQPQGLRRTGVSTWYAHVHLSPDHLLYFINFKIHALKKPIFYSEIISDCIDIAKNKTNNSHIPVTQVFQMLAFYYVYFGIGVPDTRTISSCSTNGF